MNNLTNEDGTNIERKAGKHGLRSICCFCSVFEFNVDSLRFFCCVSPAKTNDKRGRCLKSAFLKKEEQIESVFVQRALLFVGFTLPFYININASRFALIVSMSMCEISMKCVSLLTQDK